MEDQPTITATTDVPKLSKTILNLSKSLTRSTLDFTPDSVHLHKAENTQFVKDLHSTSTDLLDLTNSILCLLNKSTTPFEPLKTVLEVQKSWKRICEVIDCTFEETDKALDEYYGRNASARAASTISATLSTQNQPINIIHGVNVTRPQSKFQFDIDNSNTVPFVPKLDHKPNSLVPWTKPILSNHLPVDFVFPHPYEYEIENMTCPEHVLMDPTVDQLQCPSGLESGKYTYVDTESALDTLVQEIKSEQVIAVDVEHHEYRTYLGLTCLIQISSPLHDYIIDTLALRCQLKVLNVVLTDPNIVKVLHGADYDIIWLQRDLGLYIVNLFDTYLATKQLNFPSHSLASLLNHYCQIKADKSLQLADWRIRPLTTKMVHYARQDTHYLIYIYHQLRSELKADGILSVLKKSSLVAKKVFSKEVYDKEFGLGGFGWKRIWDKYSRPIANKQVLMVFQALHYWRDTLARDEDESPRYVLPNHMLFQVVDKLPTEYSDVLACMNPVPPLVRVHGTDIALLVRDILALNDSHGGYGPIPTKPTVPTHIRFDDLSDDSGPDLYTRKQTPVQVTLSLQSDFFGTPSSIDGPVAVEMQNRVRMILAAMTSIEALMPKMYNPDESGNQNQSGMGDPNRPAYEPPVHVFKPTSATKVSAPIDIKTTTDDKVMDTTDPFRSLNPPTVGGRRPPSTTKPKQAVVSEKYDFSKNDGRTKPSPTTMGLLTSNPSKEIVMISDSDSDNLAGDCDDDSSSSNRGSKKRSSSSSKRPSHTQKRARPSSRRGGAGRQSTFRS